jgi:hypothetical protein
MNYVTSLANRAGFCDHGNELSSYIKDGEFVNKVSDYQLHEKHFGPWS